MARVRHDRLSAHDATFLYAESPTTSMNVGGVFVLAPSADGRPPLVLTTLTELLETRLHLVPRLRQRLLEVPLHAGFPVWVDDPAFTLDHHLQRAALTTAATWPDVLALMARLQAGRLRRDRPLWDMFLAEQVADGTAVLFLRAHHALVDGMSAIRLIQTIFATQQQAVPPWSPPALPSSRRLLAAALTQRPTRQPKAKPGLVKSSAPLLKMPPPRRGPFNVTVGQDRRLVTFEMPSAEARSLARRFDGTLQDVALTVVAGAIARLPTNRKRRRHKALRTVIPVAEAVPQRQLRLGNHAAFFVVDLPVGPIDESERFDLIRLATAAAKDAGQAQAIARFIHAGERVPAPVYAAAVPLAARTSSTNLLVTFMRGPRNPMTIGGATLRAAYASLPLGRRLALLAGILDMGGIMAFSFTADPHAVPDVELLPSNCAAVLHELQGPSGTNQP
ncbi:MAG: DUF1298 domain-containing protein [Geodermatophilaceae bacterium]|nr:DUF1298 domain-containing protein [Geodermatophilaceae bacterium]